MVLGCFYVCLFSRIFIPMEVEERMIPYILIIIVAYGSSGLAITTQEFNNEAMCRVAEQALETTNPYLRVVTECVKK